MNFLIKGVARELMGARAMMPGLCSARERNPFGFEFVFLSAVSFLAFCFFNKVEEVVEGSRAKSHVRFCWRPLSEVKAISG